MATTAEVLIDAYTRVRDETRAVLDGLDADALIERPDPASNPIGWLVWHLVRVQDDHVAAVAGAGQRWTTGGWHARSGVVFDPEATGYGQSAQEVGELRIDPGTLLGYLEDVHDATVAFLAMVDPQDLDRVVDRRWDPPVTLGVRLVSVLADDLQHVGQAAYVRGLLDRREQAG